MAVTGEIISEPRAESQDTEDHEMLRSTGSRIEGANPRDAIKMPLVNAHRDISKIPKGQMNKCSVDTLQR